MSLDLYLEPNLCPHCGRSDEGYSTNITHNLGNMAEEAGIYGILWHPEDNGIKQASQLIEPITKALVEMRKDPARFKQHDAPNGWGTYRHLIRWLEDLISACRQMPTAAVRASR